MGDCVVCWLGPNLVEKLDPNGGWCPPIVDGLQQLVFSADGGENDESTHLKLSGDPRIMFGINAKKSHTQPARRDYRP